MTITIEGARSPAPDPPAWRSVTAAFVVGALLAGSIAAGVTASYVRSDSTVATGTAGSTASTAHDHAAAATTEQPLDAATRATLVDQLTRARAAATKYPTVKDAKAAGLLLAGGLVPGSGVHYQVLDNTDKDINPDGTVNPDLPASYIYRGVADDDPLVGLMYISMKADAPQGFAGPNDVWHQHANVCYKITPTGIQVPFSPDSDVTKAMCDRVEGTFMAKTVWMVHTWVMPGWESPSGVFSHDHPGLTCKDGTNAVDDRGFCQAA